jgi:hypothetical protein
MSLLRGALIATAIMLAEPAVSHELYPRDCCSGQDCRPALSGEIEVMADGRYLIVPTGEMFTRSQVRPSFDEHYHRCLYNPANPVSRTFCVFVPAGS